MSSGFALRAALVIAVLTPTASLTAQVAPKPHFSGGVTLTGAVPNGSFGNQIERAFGIGANARYQVDQRGHFAVRLDGSWLNHGWNNENVEIRSPLGGKTDMKLNSINNLFFLELGPEFSVAVGKLRPYVGASAGAAYFVTAATAKRSDRRLSLSMSAQQHDVVFAYGGRTGVRIPVAASNSGISIDVGTEYKRSTEAVFLRKEDIVVDDEGTLSLRSVRGNADLWAFHVGVSMPASLRGKR